MSTPAAPTATPTNSPTESPTDSPTDSATDSPAPGTRASSHGSASTALLTDHYELTMLQAALASGEAHRRCVFETFARRLPDGRRYGVVAGTGRFLEALERFRFGEDQLRFLADHRVVDRATIDWLADYRFTGTVSGYAEGECYFPQSPVLVVESTFAEGVVLETLVLSIINHDTAIASAASRMTTAAGGRPCIEMGSRRTHEEAAVAAARAAYIAGFDATSNLEAGRRYGVPTTGTSAHAFTLLYDSERQAFTAQVDSLGKGTTLLVDTYDVKTAVDLAIEIAGPELGAVRLDSGDLLIQAREVRAQLDAAGNTETRVIVTSDLDEYAIAALAAGPVSGYGVGTALVTGSGAPTASMVYKLVAREDSSGTLQGVAKKSKDKTSVGGRKWALRRRNGQGVAQAEVIGVGEAPLDDGDDRPLMIDLVRDGQVVDHQDIHEARARHAASRAELPRAAAQLSRGEPVIPTLYEED
ncbi:nicotinate phosphoribosyltransferase [Intrasporangium oryzae NRRL B-24470]|uniref:Nicotinate phosphoribosyltransferase n=1 Tax=Intrasporangium oryzae NRRL B-24470 TaxID=1386089 RepID=W9G827_9MICO|nr:nicotinate phosphoribosyltransferase [Intrasporangium oryzae]EWT00973.1 nicotinate phosphoribosyltransferase [Intrasporangium oryzae NRRL B-24470]